MIFVQSLPLHSHSRSLSRSHTRSNSKGRGISLSQNNYSTQIPRQQTVNINVFVESVSLKQPKININCFYGDRSIEGIKQNCVQRRGLKGDETTKRKNPLFDVKLNRPVYLNQPHVKYNSPGIFLSLKHADSVDFKQNEEKIEYKRKSVSIQQSKMFQTAILQNKISTPIKYRHKHTPLGSKSSFKTTPLKKSIFRHMTEY